MARKGKKVWRSIQTQQIDDALEAETLEERQQVRVGGLPDSDLFVVDTAEDTDALTKARPRKRQKPSRPLRCQAIIGAAHKGRPVNKGSSRPKLRGPAAKTKRQQQAQQLVQAKTEAPLNMWPEATLDGGLPPAKRRRRQSTTIRAVEIDAPGCSYNPDAEHHQAAIAKAVAAEVTKQFAEDLVPEQIKVPRLPEASELDQLLEDAVEDGTDSDGAAGDTPASSRWQQTQKKTRAVRNRERRRREAESAVQEKRSLKKQRRDLESLKALEREIAAEEGLKAAQAARRAADKRDATIGPPRLGKHRFEPEPIQVLLSEEVGALRRLKGTPVLASERFKSIQKRGIIEAAKKCRQPKSRHKRTLYTPGETSDRLKAGHEETQRIIKAGSALRAAHARKKQAF